jgi:hypothetical protein
MGLAHICLNTGKSLEEWAILRQDVVMGAAEWDELVTHLARTTALPESSARRVVEEVVAYCSESLEMFVRRRHRELQEEGLANPEIFRSIASALSRRPVAAPSLSERQIRRIIYG